MLGISENLGGACFLLRFMAVPLKLANTQLDVYEMRADNSGWFVNHHIDLDAVAGVFPEMIMSSSLEFWELTSYGFEILAFVRGESDEDSFSVLLHITGKVIPYDFKEKNFVMFNVFISMLRVLPVFDVVSVSEAQLFSPCLFDSDMMNLISIFTF